jgi:hypothetical protein
MGEWIFGIFFDALFAGHHPGNAASRRVLEKLVTDAQ